MRAQNGSVGLFVLLLIPILAVGIVRVVWNIQFDINCGKRLERAATANSISIANEEMEAALRYIEAHKLTSGYTSILWKSPEEDVEFWYRNLVASQEELESLLAKSEGVSAMESSNVLLKLRESLMGKDRHIAPPGISAFPSNTAMAFAFFITGLAFVVGLWHLLPEHSTIEILIVIAIIGILVATTSSGVI